MPLVLLGDSRRFLLAAGHPGESRMLTPLSGHVNRSAEAISKKLTDRQLSPHFAGVLPKKRPRTSVSPRIAACHRGSADRQHADSKLDATQSPPRLETDAKNRGPKWTRRGSNPQPPACKAGALPIELRAQAPERSRFCKPTGMRLASHADTGILVPWRAVANTVPANGLQTLSSRTPTFQTPSFEMQFSEMQYSEMQWAHQDSNLGPRPYQGRALTN